MSIFNRKSFNFEQKQGLVVNPSRRSDFSHDLRKHGALSAISSQLTHSFEGVEGADDTDADNLVRETFSSLFEVTPQQSTNPVSWASKAMEIAQSLPEFDQMKIYTEKDGDMSAIGTSQILEAVKDQIAEMRRQVIEQEQQQDQDGDQDGQGEGQDQGYPSGNGQGEPQDGEGQDGEGNGQGQGTDPNGIREDGEGQDSDQDGDQDGEGQEFQPTQEQIDNMRSAMRNAMSQAIESMEDLDECLKGAGIGGSENPQDEKDRTQLVRKLQNCDRIRNLLKEAGRVMMMPSAKPSKTKDGGFVPSGVEFSGDLSRMIGSEFVNLGIEELELDLYSRMINNRLMTVKRKGKEPLGRGPVVLCVDESGSMGGNRHDVARALSVATVNLMARDNRNTTIIGYNYSIRNVHTFNGKYKTMQLNGRSMGWGTGIHHLASVGCGGGTDFDPALRKSLEVIGKEERADLIFLTDGDASVSRSLIDRLETAKGKGLRVTTILIGGGRSSAVEAISDTVHREQDLTSELSAQIIGDARTKAV